MPKPKVWGPPLSFRLKIKDYDRLCTLVTTGQITEFLRETTLEKITQLEKEAAS